MTTMSRAPSQPSRSPRAVQEPARKATTPADAVQEAERNLTAKRQELEAAVAAGDVDAVLRLRVFTEVEGPRALTVAKVAKVDADIEELEAAIESGALDQAVKEAEARYADARAALEQAQQALREADRVAREAQQADYAVSNTRSTASRRLAELQKKRAQLVEKSESEIAARIRAIAGLEPEIAEETPAHDPNRVNKVIGAYDPRPANVFSKADPQ
jgi:dGTP triphosphohydrolase